MVNGLNVGLTAKTTFDFTSFRDVAAGQGMRLAEITQLRQEVIGLVKRYYAPFDINIVVVSANSLAGIRDTLIRNNLTQAKHSDSYVLVAGVVPSAGRIDQGLNGQAGDTDYNAANTHDDTSLVLANHLFANGSATALWRASAYTIAHEAGHNFGLEHTQNASPGNNRLLTTSDMMSQFYDMAGVGNPRADQRDNFNFFSRFPMPTVSGSSATQNAYNDLANDPQIGLRPGGPAYVTGTCAHDRIAIVSLGHDRARVTVQAFSEAARTRLIGSYTYLISAANGVVVENGYGDDEVVLDAKLGRPVTVHGMTGNDRLVVDGAGLPADLSGASVTFPGFATTIRGAAYYHGVLRAGNMTVSFDEFNTPGDSPLAGSGIDIRNFSQFTFTPMIYHDHLTTIISPAEGTTRLQGVGSAARFVPFDLVNVGLLTVQAARPGFFTHDAIGVQGIASGSRLQLHLGNGQNQVVLGGNGASSQGFGTRHNNLDDLNGTIAIRGGSGRDSVVVNDQATNVGYRSPQGPGASWSDQVVFTVNSQSVVRENNYSWSVQGATGGSAGFTSYRSRIGFQGGIDSLEINAGRTADTF